jgi:hypothetical protein
MMDEALWGISGTVRIVTPPKGAGTTHKCEAPLLDAHHPPIWGGHLRTQISPGRGNVLMKASVPSLPTIWKWAKKKKKK